MKDGFSTAEFWYIKHVTALSLYLHIPFCRHRCGYCDFNTYAGIENIIPDYISALAAEIRWMGVWNVDRLPVHTVYFGGGTPSLLPAAGIQRILQEVSDNFQLSDNAEVSLEANPGTLSLDYLKDLRKLGINRLSLGMQSAHPGELALLEREHSYLDVINSFTWARKASFDNINLDLIFGLPEQAAGTWKRSLELGLGLHPEHFSLYSLTLEHGTPFGSWSAKGLISQPDPDLLPICTNGRAKDSRKASIPIMKYPIGLETIRRKRGVLGANFPASIIFNTGKTCPTLDVAQVHMVTSTGFALPMCYHLTPTSTGCQEAGPDNHKRRKILHK
jgi:coproporphyrinogen III oxidase-like Fe-S oxidoreductase